MRIQFTLGEDDAKKYPEGDGTFVWDSVAMSDMRSTELIALEDHLDGHSLSEIERDYRDGKASGLRGVMYVARRLAGVNERWDHFDPKPWKATFTRYVPTAEEGESADPTSGSETAESPTP